MKIHTNAAYITILMIAAILFSGCEEAQTNSGNPINSENRSAANMPSESSRIRFQQPASEGPSAVESAIELSRKYSALLEDIDKLRQENQRLTEENKSLKQRVQPCETQLAQTQKELNEANELLIDMRIELNNWKANVLGFRDEMRQADRAQLEALLKIITVLGGEVGQNPGNPDDTSSATPNDSTEPEQPLARDNSNG